MSSNFHPISQNITSKIYPNEIAIFEGRHKNIQIDLFYTYSLIENLIPKENKLHS
ncbi:MAG UNVERIFIED_CONTAM: hypothetical protein LVQ98_00780 [Rickettsiaceae bacterium]